MRVSLRRSPRTHLETELHTLALAVERTLRHVLFALLLFHCVFAFFCLFYLICLVSVVLSRYLVLCYLDLFEEEVVFVRPRLFCLIPLGKSVLVNRGRRPLTS